MSQDGIFFLLADDITKGLYETYKLSGKEINTICAEIKGQLKLEKNVMFKFSEESMYNALIPRFVLKALEDIAKSNPTLIGLSPAVFFDNSTTESIYTLNNGVQVSMKDTWESMFQGVNGKSPAKTFPPADPPSIPGTYYYCVLTPSHVTTVTQYRLQPSVEVVVLPAKVTDAWARLYSIQSETTYRSPPPTLASTEIVRRIRYYDNAERTVKKADIYKYETVASFSRRILKKKNSILLNCSTVNMKRLDVESIKDGDFLWTFSGFRNQFTTADKNAYLNLCGFRAPGNEVAVSQPSLKLGATYVRDIVGVLLQVPTIISFAARNRFRVGTRVRMFPYEEDNIFRMYYGMASIMNGFPERDLHVRLYDFKVPPNLLWRLMTPKVLPKKQFTTYLYLGANTKPLSTSNDFTNGIDVGNCRNGTGNQILQARIIEKQMRDLFGEVKKSMNGFRKGPDLSDVFQWQWDSQYFAVAERAPSSNAITRNLKNIKTLFTTKETTVCSADRMYESSKCGGWHMLIHRAPIAFKDAPPGVYVLLDWSLEEVCHAISIASTKNSKPLVIVVSSAHSDLLCNATYFKEYVVVDKNGTESLGYHRGTPAEVRRTLDMPSYTKTSNFASQCFFHRPEDTVEAPLTLKRLESISPAQEKLLCYMQRYLDEFIPDTMFLEDLLAIMFIGTISASRVVLCDYGKTVLNAVNNSRDFAGGNRIPLGGSHDVFYSGSGIMPYCRVLGFYLLDPAPLYISYTKTWNGQLTNQRCWLIVSYFEQLETCFEPFFVAP